MHILTFCFKISFRGFTFNLFSMALTTEIGSLHVLTHEIKLKLHFHQIYKQYHDNI